MQYPRSAELSSQARDAERAESSRRIISTNRSRSTMRRCTPRERKRANRSRFSGRVGMSATFAALSTRSTQRPTRANAARVQTAPHKTACDSDLLNPLTREPCAATLSTKRRTSVSRNSAAKISKRSSTAAVSICSMGLRGAKRRHRSSGSCIAAYAG